MAEQNTPASAGKTAAKKTRKAPEEPKAPVIKVGDTVQVVVARGEPVEAEVKKVGPGNFADLEFEFEGEPVAITKSPFAPYTPEEPNFKAKPDSWFVEAE